MNKSQITVPTKCIFFWMVLDNAFQVHNTSKVEFLF